jgi:hypothetical protein
MEQAGWLCTDLFKNEVSKQMVDEWRQNHDA